MPRNGAGVFSLVNNTWFPPVNGVLATSTDWSTFIIDIQNALTQSVSSDGQTPMTGNLPMGNNKITGLALGTANTDAASLANLNAIAGQAGGVGDRNLLINGNFALNQRAYVSGVAAGAGNQYALDRWRIVNAGSAITFGAGTPDVIVTVPSGGIEQPIEAGMMAGGVYTLSWSGTATATVNGVAITNGGNTGTLTANTIAVVKFVSGTVTRAQFELGTAATPYQRRQLQAELALCQRFYCKSYQYPVVPGTNTGVTGGGEDSGFFGITPSSISCSARFPVTMRISNPAVSSYDALGNGTAFATTFTGGAVQQNNQPATLDNLSERGFKAFVSVNTPARIFFHWTANAEI